MSDLLVATPTVMTPPRIHLPPLPEAEIYYPESDGEPMGETDIHVDEIATILKMLKIRYLAAPDVHVAGNSFIYYEEGDPTARFSPDCYVVFGVPKRLRRTYKLWIEKRAPVFVMEISSRKTWLEDFGNKKALCAYLGIAEYFLYDPENDYLKPPLQGFRLKGALYESIEPEADGSLFSETLGLRFHLENDLIQLTDAASGERLLRPEEADAARRAAEAARRAAEAQAVKEAKERYAAEARLAELEAELERLRGKQQ